MKNSIAFVAILFAAFTSNAQTDAFTLRVEGLGCPFCAYGLEKKFRDVENIKALSIDIQTGKMTFNVPSSNKMTLEDADARVTRAGYTAKGIAVVRANGSVESIGDVVSAVAPTPMNSSATRKSFKVAGNCSMCKARIEKAARSVAGVSKAEWDVDTKVLAIEFDPQKAKVADVQTAIARSGHDNAGANASTATYDSLPACCQYKRN